MQTDLKTRTEKEHAAAAESDSMLSAIGKSMAQIEFDLDGTIRTANTNFLRAVGYSLEELKGHHHRMFVSPSEAGSAAYAQFWDKLRSGQHDAGQYLRLDKHGGKSGCRRVTTRSWTRQVSPSRSSSSRPTSPIRYGPSRKCGRWHSPPPMAI